MQPNDIYRSTLHWTMAGQKCVNVWHWRSEMTTSDPTTVQTRLASLIARVIAIQGALATNVHESITFDKIDVVGVHAQVALYARTHDLNAYGLRTGELLPGFVASPIYLGTAYAGRSRRGRTHVGGWLEADQDAGVLVPAAITRAEQIRDQIMTQAVGTSDWKMIIYSRKIAEEQGMGPIGTVPNAPGGAGTPWANVLSGTVSPVLGSMYSRKIGRGS
jgi:hypothetical protein